MELYCETLIRARARRVYWDRALGYVKAGAVMVVLVTLAMVVVG